MEYLINYLDNQGVKKTILFDTVIREWVQEEGGILSAMNALQKMNRFQLENIPLQFILYFITTYKAKLPEDDDKDFQEYLYHVDVYMLYFRRLAAENDDRPTSPSNIKFFVLVAIVILFLVSLCSNR